ncbi:MAG: hypothetical protein ACKVXR_06235 [Planctomycetota bacterium]
MTFAAVLAAAPPAQLPAGSQGLAGLPEGFTPIQEQKSRESRGEPGPRAPVAGIAGFDSLSKVRFASSPEIVRDLKVTCSFPERMRWMLSAQVDGLLVRELQYQYGDAVYRIPNGTGRSEVCEGDARTAVLRQLRLRLAVMLFPDGFEWKGDGDERTTDLGALGSLRARVSAVAGGQPVAIDCIDAAGRVTEGYRGITWRKNASRSWPAAMEYWRGEERVWAETLETVDTSALFVDSFFLPPDLREGSTARPVGGGIRTLEVPEICVLRASLAAGATWESALRVLEELRTTHEGRLDEGGLLLEEIATLETSDDGKPVAAVLRLMTMPEKPPEGFSKEAARRGLAVAIEGLERVDGNRIAELRRGLPKGSVPGRPYVRVDRKGEANRRVVLVLPFDPAR